MKWNFRSIVIDSFILFILFSIFSCQSKKNIAPELIKDSLVYTYPPEARAKHLEGTVILRILINDAGTVDEARVYQSSGYDILDNTAVNVAKNARFKPAKIEGQPKAVWITWPLVFEFTSLKFVPEEWITQALEYQNMAASSNITKKQLNQQSLFYHYKDFASYMVEHRSVALNDAELKVVLPQLRRKWEGYKYYWPLTFILFQDYILRYPESEFRQEAENYLVEYLKNEIFQLNVRDDSSLSDKNKREIYDKIFQYLKDNFPDEVKNIKKNF